MDIQLINSIEAILFGSGRPLRISQIKKILDSSNCSVELSDIKRALNELELRYSESALELNEVASGYRLRIKNNFNDILNNLWPDKSPRLSKALLETISIIAYKQPVTRGDIEDIRGITVSTRTIRFLLEQNWVKISGYKDVPGKPALYKTTKIFLDDFNLKSLTELPDLPDVEDILDIDPIAKVV